ncbi:MAG TPA: amidohydrolase family protein [Spirochaetia bacterium]|nr:amidohydrolase family protein [Spirochaetia bacterium]
MSLVSEPFIVDAHVHTGYLNLFFSPEVDAKSLLARMDALSIQYAVNLGSSRNLLVSSAAEMEKAEAEFRESGKRLFYCGFFDPRRATEDLTTLDRAARGSGFKGIKIHPSFCGVAGDDPRYEPVWQFAAERALPIVSHTWSVSSYNPAQALSTPERFERFASRFQSVRFILGHAGGRGEGRLQAIRMAQEHANVFMDISGDVMDRHFLERMAGEKVEQKVLFGSDYPWLDQRAHLCGVFLAGISLSAKGMILRENARRVFDLP